MNMLCVRVHVRMRALVCVFLLGFFVITRFAEISEMLISLVGRIGLINIYHKLYFMMKTAMNFRFLKIQTILFCAAIRRQ